MNVSSVKLVYFSPTGTTKKILEAIADGIGPDTIEHVDMTLPDAASKSLENSTDKLVVMAAPVYAGRLPQEAINRFKYFKTENTPVVLVVLYGNREYEDALLELVDLAKELGFVAVSAAAFIGEHSFSTKDLPLSNGRPDKADTKKAADFGAAVKEKLLALNSVDDIPPLSVPGNVPYKERIAALPGAPDTIEENCTLCGVCATVCPTAAITLNDDNVITDGDLCLKCCACIKECPEDARVMNIPMVKKIAKFLGENYSQRKEPEIFL